MANAGAVREQVWERLRAVALPDSRFHLNFAEYIPDFIGSDQALNHLIALPVYRDARFLFITPDNCLTSLRERALRDGKTIVVSTYGIYRGLVLLAPEQVPTRELRFASWLDGLEVYGEPLALASLAQLGAFDLLVTGASAVSTDGIRFGKGHGFFDVEWGMFRDIGVVTETTPVAALVHDVQVVHEALQPGPTDTIVDWIVTPSGVREVARVHSRPPGILWERLAPGMLAAIPPLQELHARQKGGDAPR